MHVIDSYIRRVNHFIPSFEKNHTFSWYLSVASRREFYMSNMWSWCLTSIASFPVDSTQQHIFIFPCQVLETLTPYFRIERNDPGLDVLKIASFLWGDCYATFFPNIWKVIITLILVAINWTATKAVCCFILLDLSVTELPEFSAMRKSVLTKAVILKP